MQKQRFNFKRFALLQAILIPVATFPIWYLKFFPPATSFCVDVQNNEVVKLYDADCQQPNSVNVVKR
ncbi:hypothetical protein UH38_19230 [Aliterella atlantica CENA595]|uniref:Uncharacterized protein n=1 Tax=Aliterella atlantica CENA595 TaxID=1618023 RepID=A0A0D8ZN91_9CYAN|nr:hypothetical protein UH38_19230 [Aliterella atlantica CENA595]